MLSADRWTQRKTWNQRQDKKAATDQREEQQWEERERREGQPEVGRGVGTRLSLPWEFEQREVYFEKVRVPVYIQV